MGGPAPDMFMGKNHPGEECQRVSIEAYENLQIVRGTVSGDGARTAGHAYKVT